ncbi:hypothetical protein MYX76_06285 [Desulfobacterota bacterium AH_259_B03_O07]|nr:hypothetical protein [Desulfobacterota bacterium AH_259_B03_O07]
MQGLLFTYTRYYNQKYSKVGHLFQGRYKAILCDRDAYLLGLVGYIHLNPARINRSVGPQEYKWSSDRAYLGEEDPVGIETSMVLGQFGKTKGQAKRSYLRFIGEGMGIGHEAKYYDTVDQRLLGDDHFLEAVDRKTERKREIEKRGRHVGFSELLDAVAKVHGVQPSVLMRGGRERSWLLARAMLVYLGREWSGVKTKELARQLHCDPSMISRMYTRYAEKRDQEEEEELARLLGD